MPIQATVRVMSAEEISAQAGGQTPFLLWPERSTVFAERAMRLRQLARGHAMADFLNFMAELAMAQQSLLKRLGDGPAPALPDAQAIDRAAQMGVPPLPAVDWPRDGAWRAGLRSLLAEVKPRAPEATQAVIERLASLDDETLERQADALLHGVMRGLDMAAAPLVGAALQAWFTHLVLSVQALHGADGGKGAPFGRIDEATLCPCCGSKPVASVIRMGTSNPSGGVSAQVSGQRYLQCSLCSTQWYRLRIECTHCGSNKSIAYESLQAAEAEPGEGVTAAVVQAETCDECGHYLKLMHGDRDPMCDAVADDLASLTLDLLVSDNSEGKGRIRHGVNLMLLFGEPESAEAPDDAIPRGEP